MATGLTQHEQITQVVAKKLMKWGMNVLGIGTIWLALMKLRPARP
jgi:hypothetical protein